MDPLRLLFDLFNIGARLRELRLRVTRAFRQGVTMVALLSVAVFCILLAILVGIYAIDRALVPHLGEVWAAGVIALALLLLAVILAAGAYAAVKPAKRPPPPALPEEEPREMSFAALVALLGGIVAGSVLQSRKDRAG